jgi:hypothetical protein
MDQRSGDWLASRTRRNGGGAWTSQSTSISFAIRSPSRRRSSMAIQPAWESATDTTERAPLASMTAMARPRPVHRHRTARSPPPNRRGRAKRAQAPAGGWRSGAGDRRRPPGWEHQPGRKSSAGPVVIADAHALRTCLGHGGDSCGSNGGTAARPRRAMALMWPRSWRC